MLIPKVSDYSIYRDFVVALMAANKGKRFFSHRFLARKLGFPSSYLNDVVSGRKALTLNRAIQMAQALNLDVFDTEYLVILVLQESHFEPVRQHFSKFLKQRFARDGADYVDDRQGRYADITTFAIQAFAIGKTAEAVVQRAPAELYTFSGVSTERVEAVLRQALDDGLLALDHQGLFRERRSTFVQSENLTAGADPIHLQYAQNFAAYCAHRRGPATMNAFFLRIPRDRFLEVRDKMLAMRDWIRQLRFDEPRGVDDEMIVFQCDLNLFPVTKA